MHHQPFAVGYNDDAMLIQTFGGSVWQDSAWTLAVADSDGLIEVNDPQTGRAPAQSEFLARLVDRVRRTHPDPSDVLITASLGKTDIVSAGEVRAARESLRPMGWPISTHNGLDGAGVHEAAGVLMAALVARRLALPHSQDGVEALRQARWDPFRE